MTERSAYPPKCRQCPMWSRSQGYCPPDPVTPRTKLIVYGESAGEDEARIGRGFVGLAGAVLREAELRAGFDVPMPEKQRAPDGKLRPVHLDNGGEVAHANVVCCRPPANKFPGPEVVEYCWKVHSRVHEEYARSGLPVVACGANASQALSGFRLKILSTRGTLLPFRDRSGWFLSTLHPSYLCRMSGAAAGQDHLRPLLALDLVKAAKCLTPRMPQGRTLSPADLRWMLEGLQPELVSVDIEGRDGKPSLVGFSWPDDSPAGTYYSCWWSDELKTFMQDLFADESIQFVFHNGSYDVLELQQAGVPMPRRAWWDTIVMAAVVNQDLPLRLESQVLTYVSGAVAWKGLVDHTAGPDVETSRVLQYKDLWQRVQAATEVSTDWNWRARYQLYNGLDVTWTLELCQQLRQSMGRQLRTYTLLHQPLQRPLLEMGNRGMPVDPSRMKQLRQECLNREARAQELLTRVGHKVLLRMAVDAYLEVRRLREARRQEREAWKASGGKGRPKFSQAAELTKARTRYKARRVALAAGFNMDSPMQRVALLMSLGIKVPKDRKTKGATTNEKMLTKVLKRIETGTLRVTKGRRDLAIEVLNAMMAGKKYATIRRNFLERGLEG